MILSYSRVSRLFIEKHEYKNMNSKIYFVHTSKQTRNINETESGTRNQTCKGLTQVLRTLSAKRMTYLPHYPLVAQNQMYVAFILCTLSAKRMTYLPHYPLVAQNQMYTMFLVVFLATR